MTGACPKGHADTAATTNMHIGNPKYCDLLIMTSSFVK
jgi:hypothetical protein